MLYLIWAVINIAAYVYFIYVLIISGKLVRQKLGVLAACVFVLGLLSFMNGSDKNSRSKNNTADTVQKWKQYQSDSLDKNMNMTNWIKVDSNWISSYSLFYTHGKIKGSNQRIPLEASSTMSGLSLGTQWKPYDINMEPLAHKEGFKYTVYGTVDWYLMGIRIYSQEKTYTGVAPAINRF